MKNITNLSSYKKEKKNKKKITVMDEEGNWKKVEGGIFQSHNEETSTQGKMSVMLQLDDYKGFLGDETTDERLDFLVESFRDWLNDIVSNNQQLNDYVDKVRVSVVTEEQGDFILFFSKFGEDDDLGWICGKFTDDEEKTS